MAKTMQTARAKKRYWEQLPDEVTAQDIADILTISRRRVYELFDLSPEAGGIPSYSIGKSRRADKTEVMKWKDSLREKQRVSYMKGKLL